VPGDGGRRVAQVPRCNGGVPRARRADRRVLDTGHRCGRLRQSALRRPRNVRRCRVVCVCGAHHTHQLVPFVSVFYGRPTGGRDRVLCTHVLAKPVRVHVRDTLRAAVLLAVHEVHRPQPGYGGHRRADRGRAVRARRAAARPRWLGTIRRGQRTPTALSLLLVGHGTAAGGRGRAAPDQAPADPRGHGLAQAHVCRAHRPVAVQPVRDGPVRRLLPLEELGRSTRRRLGQRVHIPVDQPVHVPIFRHHHDGGRHRKTGELIIY